MAVRAKMRVTHLQEYTQGGHDATKAGMNVGLMPVFGAGDDKANAEWSKWTPSGELKLTITNPAAYNQFELGKAYYVTLTPCEE